MIKQYSLCVIIILFMKLVLLTSCHVEDLTFTSMPYQLADGTSFEYVQILSGMDEDHKNKVNEALYDSSTEWIVPEYCWLADCKWDVVFQSNKYITICYSFNLNLNSIPDGQYRSYTTIDLQSGQIMRLNDFIKDAELFVQQIKSNFTEIEETNIQDMYSGASSSVDEYFSQLVDEFDPLARSYPISYLLNKPDFYLVDGGIGIKYSEYIDEDIFLQMEL